MTLTDIAGVLSRYLVIGFLLPAFFALVALSTLATESALPNPYRDLRPGAQVAVLGGTALLVALVLSGIHYNVIRVLEGYPSISAGAGSTSAGCMR
jgi:hypothetical protein